MKISVITATWNCVGTLGDCLDSVASQQWRDREHLVIDGASTDGTVALLDSRREQLAVVLSEPDRGIYDALNKGIARATGDVVGFLHADDVLADERVLSRVAACFEDRDVDAVYGDLVYVGQNDPDRVIRDWVSRPFAPYLLRQGWMPPHPTLYIRREVYARLGGFNLQYRIAADYDFMLRLFSQPDINSQHIPSVLVKMRVGGASNRSLANILKKSHEDWQVLRANQVGGLGALLWKNLSKLGQFRPRLVAR